MIRNKVVIKDINSSEEFTIWCGLEIYLQKRAENNY